MCGSIAHGIEGGEKKVLVSSPDICTANNLFTKIIILIGEDMNKILNEDWLSVIIAFLLIALALIGLINPSWMKF